MPAASCARAFVTGILAFKKRYVIESANRRFAISIYSGTQSIAMNPRPDFFAATAVVPAPENGSSTTPSDGQLAFKQMSTSDSG